MRSSIAVACSVLASGLLVASCSATPTRGNGFGGASTAASSGSETTNGSSSSGLILEGGVDGAQCAGATSCEKEGVTCGPIGDGCGGILQCGDCSTGKSCGGGGTPGKCGAPTCVKKTCQELGANCGPVGDGCGGMLSCGDCSNGETCGGGGTASVCGSGSSCTPATCESLAVNCGPVGDGCGNLLQCGTCTGNQTCGGGGIGSVCGAPPCTPTTCMALGLNCGPTGDGCGGVLQCGTCSQPDTCGGAGDPSVCGVSPSCTGLCLQQVSCSGGATTSISGTIYAPNGVDPLPNALVYVPNGTVQPFTPGVTCDNCGAPASGDPLVSTITAVDGTFTLTNVPTTDAPPNAPIPLVVQLGRWRRQTTLTSVPACQNTAADPTTTNLPQNQSQGDIPLMAFSTGAVDALECVLRKIGVDDSEFTAPGGGGRIVLYEGLTDPNSEAAGGAIAPGGSPTEDQLWGSTDALDQYDVVFFPCQSDQTTRSSTVQQNLIDYANAGGRVFATHFSYVWLYDDAPFSGTASWDVEQHPSPANQTGLIDTSFPKGQLLAQWLQIVGASTTYAEIPVQVIRHDEDGPIAPSQSWMTIPNDPNFPGANIHMTFNTPVGAPASQQCGRVLFDDFHVENVSDSNGMVFPSECAAGPMSPQEKLLEFMIFDLSSCVTADVPPPCQAKTCGDLGVGCGPAGDGCGNLIQCGDCPMGQTCGGGGTPSQCGAPSCTPETCQSQGIQCGNAGDGCGNAIVCGSCPAGQTCGGGGMPGVCGTQPCTPLTCGDEGVQCGPAGDGCGGLLQCGTCVAPETCGGGGMPGICGAPTCTPETCAQLGFNCGPAGDGCGGMQSCGTCTAPQTCGGGGQAGVCGGSGPT